MSLHNTKVGDYIWTVRDDWQEVKSVNPDILYPIDTKDLSFTFEGKEVEEDKNPSAFTRDILNDTPRPGPVYELSWSKVPEDTPVRVVSPHGECINSFFKEVVQVDGNDVFECYVNGNTSLETSCTEYWEVCQLRVEENPEWLVKVHIC